MEARERSPSRVRQPVTSGVVRALEREMEADESVTWSPHLVDGLRRPGEMPAVIPLYHQAFVDREGWIWVQEYPLPGGPAKCLILNPTGEVLLRIELPRPPRRIARLRRLLGELRVEWTHLLGRLPTSPLRDSAAAWEAALGPAWPMSPGTSGTRRPWLSARVPRCPAVSASLSVEAWKRPTPCSSG